MFHYFAPFSVKQSDYQVMFCDNSNQFLLSAYRRNMMRHIPSYRRFNTLDEIITAVPSLSEHILNIKTLLETQTKGVA
jgi:hypothetical protein